MLGLSFMFTWYSIIGNIQDIQEKSQNFWMVVVYGSMFTCPVLFMIAGFL